MVTVSPQKRPNAPFPARQQARPGIEAEPVPLPRFEVPRDGGANELRGRVALITAGDTCIGRSLAVLFAREGADVALVYPPRQQRDAEETRYAVVREGRTALLIPGDATQPAFYQGAVERTVRELGRLDVLVNNPADSQHRWSPEGFPGEQWDHTFETNAYGYFRLARA
jgi:NAD(P)-dependent dehydrogenase (short-subunit alcohol dehydrogenase family)